MSGKQGQFDKLFVKRDPITNEVLEVVGIEAKGSITSVNDPSIYCSRIIDDGTRDQQLTEKYGDFTVRNMADNLDQTLVGNILQEVLNGDVPFKYILVKQNPTDITKFIVKEIYTKIFEN